MRPYKLTLFLVITSGFAALIAYPALGKVSVVTTIPDLRALVSEVGGDNVSVDAIAKGTQDPHYVEAKPSFMTKTSRADLVVAVGLDLEIGWLPSILRGARNPKVNPGSRGYLEIGPQIDPIEVPKGPVTRAQGDVHPLGNPHFFLDPIRMGTAAMIVAKRLGELDVVNESQYLDRAKAVQNRFEMKTKAWKERIEKSGVTKVITYHKTLNYFFDRFHIENSISLEPKPGIPPTSGHILKVIQLIRQENIPLIVVENYFDPTVTKRIKEEVPTLRTAVVPASVDGKPGIHSTDDLIDFLVMTVEGR